MSTRIWGVAVLAAIVLATLGSSLAAADYGPGADAVSAFGAQLGDRDATAPAVSGDGRYVVFSTASPVLLGDDGVGSAAAGLLRRDLLTGALDAVVPRGVAVGSTSVSADGRSVAFETSAALTPGDLNGVGDVYLRDMSRPATDVSAYTLVSALDGTDEAAAYAPGAAGSRIGQAGFALSADGQTATFWSSGASNLPSGGAVATATGQVLVRDLASRRTRLMTQAVNGGGPVARAAPGTTVVAPGPALSADGSAVVWADADAALQTTLLPGEPEPALAYLWRRTAERATTRRVAGAGDRDDPACDPQTTYAAGDTGTGACYGPFVDGDAVDSVGNPEAKPLSISADGGQVLFLSSARQRPFDATRYRAGSVYLADMAAGRSRKGAVLRVLSAPSGAIREAVLAASGRRALLSAGTAALEGARVIGTLPGGGSSATNLYVLDLVAGTVQRATVGADGSDYAGALVSADTGSQRSDPEPAFLGTSADATTLVFAAADGNLFVGDANGVRDVQVLRGTPGIASGAGTAALPAPAPPAALAAASLPSIAALKPIHPIIGYPIVGSRGRATLTIRVPAAGRLSIDARARSGRARITVAKTARTPRAATTVTARLSPSRAARRANARVRLRVTIRVRYVPKSGAATTATRTYAIARGRAR
jgi:hypothetical protein